MLTNAIRKEDKAQLALTIEQGNVENFSKLYDVYAPALTGIITRMANENILVQNILHSSFINAWQQIDRFNPSFGTFFTWLLRITRKTAFEFIAIDNSQNHQYANYVTTVLPLKSNKESAFCLVYFKGFTIEEAAKALDVSVIIVKDNIKFTIQKMKQSIEL